ncbi:MAG: hypothetical protein RIM99_20425 [Cyclobacteriaceae bacterium]
MELDNYEKLYRSMFEKTNGFVLNWPIGRTVDLGNFFTIKPGNLSVVGKVSDKNMEMIYFDPYENDDINFSVPSAEPDKKERARIGKSVPPDYLWKLKDGCVNDYVGDKILHTHKHKIKPPQVKQFVTRLENPSSFFFAGKNVKYKRVLDFYKVHQRIIRRLATQFFNYNEIYLITEVAEMDQFSLGVSRGNEAELVMSPEEYFNGDILELVNTDYPVTVEKADRFQYLKIREKEMVGSIAFKALKMSLSMKAKEAVVRKIYDSQDSEVRANAVELINNDLNNVIPSIEINSSNASDFFEWGPMGLEDLEVFLGK